ncbi:MAG TPA: hypothetical protein VK066_11615 [Chloroflexota bacterium]|nr:hypothetical protein [Chloroflexota bacterium]
MPRLATRHAAGASARARGSRSTATRCLAALAALVTLGSASLAPAGAPALAQGPPAAVDSPLARHDVPEGDAQAQLRLDASGSADLWCSFGPSGATNPSGTSDCAVDAGAPLGLRFPGLAPNRDLTVQVTPSGGAPQQAAVPTNADGLGEWDWISQPSDPLGAYTVSATQDDRQVSGVFVVRQAASPQIMTLLDSGPAGPVYGSPTGGPGTAFRVVLSGFAPGQPVPLRAYRAFGDTYLFAADLGAVPADDRGAAAYTLRTAAGDPEGDYLIVSAPRVAGPGVLRGALRLSSRPERPAPDPAADTNALAVALVEQANRIFARVVARDGTPTTDLESAFAGAALDLARSGVDQMRGQGMYREARLTAPVTLQSAQRTLDGAVPRLEAVVTEQWDDRLFNRDGSLVGTLPSRLQQRYVFERRSGASARCQTACWLVVDTQLLGQQ